MRSAWSMILVLAVCAPIFGGSTADAILKSTPRRDGVCVLVNVSDPEVAIDIARNSKFDSCHP